MDELDKWEQWGNINRATGKHKMSGVTYFIYVYVYVYCNVRTRAYARARVFDVDAACTRKERTQYTECDILLKKEIAYTLLGVCLTTA